MFLRKSTVLWQAGEVWQVARKRTSLSHRHHHHLDHDHDLPHNPHLRWVISYQKPPSQVTEKCCRLHKIYHPRHHCHCHRSRPRVGNFSSRSWSPSSPSPSCQLTPMSPPHSTGRTRWSPSRCWRSRSQRTWSWWWQGIMMRNMAITDREYNDNVNCDDINTLIHWPQEQLEDLAKCISSTWKVSWSWSSWSWSPPAPPSGPPPAPAAICLNLSVMVGPTNR